MIKHIGSRLAKSQITIKGYRFFHTLRKINNHLSVRSCIIKYSGESRWMMR